MRICWQLPVSAGLILHGYVSLVAAGGVLAIDYGTEWMKVSLVKPGIPFDVLLNIDSKRKIQATAAVRGEDRWIGGDAANIASRFPDATYPSVKLLLGHGLPDSQSQLYRTVYRTDLFQDPFTNKTSYHSSEARARLPKDQIRWPEEVLALQFSHAKKLAQTAAAGENVLDTVVTVPAFFTQAERRSVVDAMEIAGLRLLALVDDGSAIAVNYAMTRTFPAGQVEHHLFYDAGAGSVRATIVSFKTNEIRSNPASETKRNVTIAEIRGLGWNRDVGGLLMDTKIRDLLELQFVNGEGKDLASSFPNNKRAQAKLLKEASRVKQVLSANVEAPARIEGLADDIDFRGFITREAFEATCRPFEAALAQTITDALTSANLSVTELTSVILVGGASRVPLVQAAVRSIVPENKIAQNLNADEAAVMGAALYGAGLSKQFKTKDIRLVDISPRPLDMSYELTNALGEPRIMTQTFHAAFGKKGIRTNLTLKTSEDFSLRFAYKSNPYPSAPLDLLEAQITGITEACLNLTQNEATNTSISITIGVNESGLLTVDQARMEFPEHKTSVADRIKGLFAGKDRNDKVDGTSGEGAPSNETVAEASEPTVYKRPASPVRLKIQSEAIGHASFSETLKKESTKRLRDLDSAEMRKRNREEARNLLEAHIYRLRDQLEVQDFIDASTDSERIELRSKIEDASQWLWDEGDKAPTKELKTARSELERAAAPPLNRITESRAQEQLNNDTATGQPSKYTQVELRSLDTVIRTNEQWLETTSSRQDDLAKNVDPVLTIAEIERRKRDLAAQVAVLQAKRSPRKTRPTPPLSQSSTSMETSSTVFPDTTSSPATESMSTTTIPDSRMRDEL